MYNNPNGYYTTAVPGSHNYYQNLYNMFGGPNPLMDNAFSSIRRLGSLAGVGMIISFLLQIVISTVISETSIGDILVSDIFYTHAISAVFQVIYILTPFVIVYFLNKPEDKRKITDFDFPRSGQAYILAVSAGLMFCLVGNFATSILSVAFSMSGIEFFAGNEDMEIPSSFLAIVVLIINYAVLPALFEEFAFRNVLLQPLRKFGDWYAIVATSFCFALLHGNMVQIPFSFVAGISLGYFRVRTGSIWTSITIHLFNNLISVIFSLYYDRHPDASMFPYYVVTAALVLIGIVAYSVFKKNCRIKLRKDPTVMSKHKTLKRATYACTPTVVAAMFYSIFNSLGLAEIQSFSGLLILAAGIIIVGYVLFKWIRVISRETQIKQSKLYSFSKVVIVISVIFMLLFLLSLVG